MITEMMTPTSQRQTRQPSDATSEQRRLVAPAPARFAQTVANLALVSFSLLVAVQSLRAAMRQPHFFNPTAVTVQRLSAVRAALPPDAVIGYRTDESLEVAAGGEGISRYYLAQYTLAPTVLVTRAPLPDVVVGDFIDPSAGGRVAKLPGLIPVRDFGLGVILLRHAP